MHKAVRNAIRLLDRIKDFEKRVLARNGALCREDHEALLDALGLLATVLTPFAPHVGEELGTPRASPSRGSSPPWPRASGVAASRARRPQQSHG